MDDNDLFVQIKQIIDKKDGSLSDEEKKVLSERIFSSIRGYGKLDGLINDDSISEIMVNRYNRIYIEKNGEIELSPIKFSSEKELMNLIQRIVGSSGREVNQANPIVDTRLFSGERVNIVLPPVSMDGPVVTIRKFPEKSITMEDLIDFGSISREAAVFLEELVKCKYNFFISGGTSSGKTTFLGALSNFIPKSERIITIEDSAELKIQGSENLIRMETRNANTAGKGAITIRDLIKTSLRMRPERIIVGEVRGKEAWDMLNAMNTGHDGSLSTGHANSSMDMLHRLESMVMEGESNIPLEAIRNNISSSIDIIIHLAKFGNGERAVMTIHELLGVRENGDYRLNCLFEKKESGLVPTGNRLKDRTKLYLAGIKDEREK